MSLHQARTFDPVGWLIRTIRAFGFEYVFDRYYGIYRAIVVDTSDPENRGRVRVQVPSIGQETVRDVPDTVWALPSMPGLSVGDEGGQLHGVFVPPNVNDQVWVQFEHGKTDNPVYMGGWLPRNNFEDGSDLIETDALRKGIRTATGHLIRLNDDESNLEITISKGDGNGGKSGTFVTMTKDEEIIMATAEGNVIHLSNDTTTLFAPDGANMCLGDGRALIMDKDGNSFGLDGGKFTVSCDEATLTATRKITLKSNVDIGKGPLYEPAVLGQKASLWYNTHVHTTTVPSTPTTPQTLAPWTKGNGLSLAVRVS